MLLAESQKSLAPSEPTGRIEPIEMSLDFDRVRVNFTAKPKKSWRISSGYRLDKEDDPYQMKFWPEMEVVTHGYVFLVSNITKRDGKKWASIYIPLTGLVVEEEVDNRRSFSFRVQQDKMHRLTLVYDKSKNIKRIIAT